MHREQISDKEAICVISIFVMGSTLILGTGGEAKNNAWMAAILAMFLAAPLYLLYSRIMCLFPGKDLFEINEQVFGKYLGKFISLLYVWYAFHLGAMILRNFGEFANTVTMPETPILVPMLFLGIACIVAAALGIEVMGRTSAATLPILIGLIIIINILVIPSLNFSNMLPILEEGISPVLNGAFSALSFPFAETVLFMGIASALKNKKSSFTMYYTGLIVAGSIIVMLTSRNILVLGNMLGNLYFPSHVAVSRIAIGEFLQRLEVTVAFVFILGVFTKASVCLLVACKGIASVFNLRDYRPITLQTGLLMIYFSQIVYKNIMDMRFWAFKVYQYYAFPFQVIIPLLIWLLAEFVILRSKKGSTTISGKQ